ncbi:MAG: CRISPR-associated endonuclease Cas2 [Patescibacteria group bacterium]
MVLDKVKSNRNQRLQEIILGTVAAAGILAVAVVAPNVVGAMAQAGILPHPRQKEIINNARTRLVRRGLLILMAGRVYLTEKGEKALRSWRLKEYKIPRPKRWDKKWRVLIFDIPERRRALRARLRQTLVSVGFVRLQDSVWLYPYECEEFMTLLKAEFKIGKDLLYLTVEGLEYDFPWKRLFEVR